MTDADTSPTVHLLDGRPLETLECRLAEIREAWDVLAGGEDSAAPTRAAAREAVLAALEFTQAYPHLANRDLGFVFRLVYEALADIDAGRAVPWLMPVSDGRTKPGPEKAVSDARGRCAALAELLHRHSGRTREASARYVFDHLPPALLRRLTASTRPGKASWRTVRKWRECVDWCERSGQGKPAGFAELCSGYDAVLALADSLPPDVLKADIDGRVRAILTQALAVMPEMRLP